MTPERVLTNLCLVRRSCGRCGPEAGRDSACACWPVTVVVAISALCTEDGGPDAEAISDLSIDTPGWYLSALSAEEKDLARNAIWDEYQLLLQERLGELPRFRMQLSRLHRQLTEVVETVVLEGRAPDAERLLTRLVQLTEEV